MKKTKRVVSVLLMALLVFSFGTTSVLAATAQPEPCVAEAAVVLGSDEIGITPFYVPCGHGQHRGPEIHKPFYKICYVICGNCGEQLWVHIAEPGCA